MNRLSSLQAAGAASNIIDGLGAAVATLVVLLGTAYYWYTRKQRAEKPWMMVPGWIPVMGHLHLIDGDIKNFALTIESKWCDVYGAPPEHPGCFEIDLAGTRLVVVCREDRLEEILQHRFPGKIERPGNLIETFNSLGATGVFAATGETWKRERKLVSAALNHSNVHDYLGVFKEMTARLVKKWTTDAKQSSTVHVARDLSHMTADTVAKVAMGRDFDFLNQPDSHVSADVQTTIEGIMARTLSPIWFWRIPFIGQYLDGRGGAIYRMQKVISSAVEEQERSAAEITSAGKKFFLQKLLSLSQSEKTKLERHRLTGNVLTLFLAGTDTTFKTLTHTLYILARDQDLQETLRKEADYFMNDTDDDNSNTNKLESASLNDLYTKLPRLKSFLHETHRHYGVPALGMSTLVDIPFCGTTLHAGANVLIMASYIGTNKICPSSKVPLGPSNKAPHVFCPERYLVQAQDGSLTCLNPQTQGGAFGTLGYGMRACPGRSYTEALSYIVLASLLHTFEWKLAPNHPIATKVVFDSVLMPDCEVCLTLTPR